jgi:lysozyme
LSSTAQRVFVSAALSALTACATEEAPPEPVAEAPQAIEVCVDDVVHGIDVSYYQGEVSWSEVAAAGYGFAIARINHSDFMDPEFDRNWAGIKEAGMLRGAYQYFEPGEDVAWQAQVVIDKLGVLGPGDLPAVIDVETDGGLPPAEVAQAVGEWLALVEAGTGKKPIIYTGKYFWQDNVASPDYADYPLWHAQYPNACQPPAAPPPDCGCANTADQWSQLVFWQYSSSGSVPGISGNVDLDVFNGTIEDLEALASGPTGGYAAELVSVDVPTAVLAGESFTARVTVRNVGTATWDTATALGTTEPRDRQSPFYAPSWASQGRPSAVEGSVAPGAEHTFELSMNAPASEATYTEHFGLVQDGVTWFGDEGGPPDDAIEMVIQVVGESAGSGGAGGADGGDGGDGGDGCDCRAAPARPRADSFVAALFVAALVGRVRRRASAWRKGQRI